MALVGSANVVIRATTRHVKNDIEKGFKGADSVGTRAGSRMGKSFSKGFNKNLDGNLFGKINSGLKAAVPDAEGLRKAYTNLNRSAQFLTTGLAALLAGVFSLGGGLVALAGSAIGASATLAGIGNSVFALISALTVAKFALGGVGKAVSALNKGSSGGSAGGQARAAALAAIEAAEKALARTIESNRETLIDANNAVRDAQLSLNEALAAGREEIQQLGFDAEDAALSEKKAALDLEKARVALARAQDLPPNSRARQEAELAYQEAELGLRRARDLSSDLNEEQDRLARTGVAGTSVMISATDALADAEANRAKTVRNALRSEQDATERLADAKKKAATAGSSGGGTNPFEGLNQAQIDFARFISDLKPKFDELSRIAAESFLPKLQTAIEELMGAPYDALAVGIDTIGSAMGDAAISFAKAVSDAENVKSLALLFTSSGQLLRTLGVVLGKLWGIVLSVMVAAAPATQAFFDKLVTTFTQFDDYLKSVKGNKTVVEFFANAQDAMSQWSSIFGNIFAAIGGIVQTNFGPGSGGQILLTWLEEATSGWADLDETVDGKKALRDFFADVATNSISILKSLGALGGVFKNLSVDQSIGETFDNLAAGAPSLESILQSFVDAGPAMGTLIANITRVIDLLVDTEVSEVFFNTLNTVVEALGNFLENEFVQKVLKGTAPLQGFLLAIGLIGTTLLIAGKVVVGYGIMVSGSLSKITGSYGRNAVSADIATAATKRQAAAAASGAGANIGLAGALTRAAAGFRTAAGAALTFALGPVGKVLIIVGLIIGALILLYNKNAEFKKAMDEVWTELSATFVEAGKDIMDGLRPLLPVFIDLINVLVKAFVPIIKSLMPIVLILAKVLIAVLEPVIGLVVVAIKILAKIITVLLAVLMPVIDVLVAVLVPVLEAVGFVLGLVGAAFEILGKVAVKVFTPIGEFFVKVGNKAKELYEKYLQPAFEKIGEVFREFGEKLGPIWTKIREKIQPFIDWFKAEAKEKLEQFLENLGVAFTWLYDTAKVIWGKLKEKIKPFVAYLREEVAPRVVKAVEDIQEKWEDFKVFMQPAVDKIKEAWGDLKTAASDVKDWLVNALAFIKEKWEDFKVFMQPAVDKIKEAWGDLKTAASDVKDRIAGAVEDMTEKWEDFKVFMQPAVDKIKEAWADLTQSSTDTKEDSVEDVGAIEKAWISLRDLLQPIVDKVKEKWDEFKDSMVLLKLRTKEVVDLLLKKWKELKEKLGPPLKDLKEAFLKLKDKLLELKDSAILLRDKFVAAFEKIKEKLTPIFEDIDALFVKLFGEPKVVDVNIGPEGQGKKLGDEEKKGLDKFAGFLETLELVIDNVIIALDLLITTITTLVDIVTFIVDAVNKKLDKAEKDFNDFKAGVEKVYNDLVDFFTPIIEKIKEKIALFVEKFNKIKDKLTEVKEKFKRTFDKIVAILEPIIKDIKKKIDLFVEKFNKIKDKLTEVKDKFKQTFNNIAGFMKTVTNNIIGTVETMVNRVVSAVNTIIGGVNSIPALGGFKVTIPTIPKVYLPRLAKGGTVFPSDGGSIVNVAEAGRPERIEPLDADGLSARDKAWAREFTGGAGGGMTFNITQNPGEDGEALAQRISRIISAKQSKWAPQ